jgi:hypothetical protein
MSFLNDLKRGQYGYSDEIDKVLNDEGIEMRDIEQKDKKIIAKLKKVIRNQ